MVKSFDFQQMLIHWQKKKAIPVGMTFSLVDDIGLDLHFCPEGQK